MICGSQHRGQPAVNMHVGHVCAQLRRLQQQPHDVVAFDTSRGEVLMMSAHGVSPPAATIPTPGASAALPPSWLLAEARSGLDSDDTVRSLYAPAKARNTQLAAALVLPLLAYKAGAVVQRVQLQWYLDATIALAAVALVVYALK